MKAFTKEEAKKSIREYYNDKISKISEEKYTEIFNSAWEYARNDGIESVIEAVEFKLSKI